MKPLLGAAAVICAALMVYFDVWAPNTAPPGVVRAFQVAAFALTAAFFIGRTPRSHIQPDRLSEADRARYRRYLAASVAAALLYISGIGIVLVCVTCPFSLTVERQLILVALGLTAAALAMCVPLWRSYRTLLARSAPAGPYP